MRIFKYALMASFLIALQSAANSDSLNQKTSLGSLLVTGNKVSYDKEQDARQLTFLPVHQSFGIFPVPVLYSDFNYADTCVFSATFFAIIYVGPDSVKWDFGDPSSGVFNFDTSAASSHVFLNQGNYAVQCIVFANNTSDTTVKQITIAPLPNVNLGIDTTYCTGETHVLVAGNSPGATYLWQDGSTASTYSATTSMVYTVTVTENGCSASDHINLTFKDLLIFPATDSTICNGSQVFLDVTNIGAGFAFQWNDGYPDPYRFIDSDGVYIATVSMGSCSKTSTYTLHTLKKPVVNLGEDTVLCSGGVLLLNASYPSSTYLWQDGSTGPSLNAAETNAYGVIVTNQCGIAADSIYIEFVECKCNLFFPKAFTPNKDNHNDLYNFKYDCLEFQSQFRIFNRWGKLMFESNDGSTGWDGTFKGKDADADAYIYVLKYSGVIEGKIQEEVKRGSFVLYR